MASATYKYYQGDVYNPAEGTYTPKEVRREQNLFIEEYYCSTDTRIYRPLPLIKISDISVWASGFLIGTFNIPVTILLPTATSSNVLEA